MLKHPLYTYRHEPVSTRPCASTRTSCGHTRSFRDTFDRVEAKRRCPRALATRRTLLRFRRSDACQTETLVTERAKFGQESVFGRLGYPLDFGREALASASSRIAGFALRRNVPWNPPKISTASPGRCAKYLRRVCAQAANFRSNRTSPGNCASAQGGPEPPHPAQLVW